MTAEVRRITIGDRRAVTIKARGLGAVVARILTGKWPTYETCLVASAVVEYPLSAAEPALRLTDTGTLEFTTVEPIRIVSTYVHEVGTL